MDGCHFSFLDLLFHLLEPLTLYVCQQSLLYVTLKGSFKVNFNPYDVPYHDCLIKELVPFKRTVCSLQPTYNFHASSVWFESKLGIVSYQDVKCLKSLLFFREREFNSLTFTIKLGVLNLNVSVKEPVNKLNFRCTCCRDHCIIN